MNGGKEGGGGGGAYNMHMDYRCRGTEYVDPKISPLYSLLPRTLYAPNTYFWGGKLGYGYGTTVF